MKRELISLNNAIVSPFYQKQTDSDVIPKSHGFVYDRFGKLIPSSQREIAISRDSQLVQPTFNDLGDFANLDGESIYLGMFSLMYGHFLLESFARVWHLGERLKGFDHYIFHGLSESDFIDPEFTPASVLFNVFGIDPKKVIVVNKPIKVSNLVIPSSQVVMKQEISNSQREVYGRVVRYCKDSNIGFSGPERIYLSRSKFYRTKRKARNESDIESVFRNLGFDIVHPQTLGFDEQVVLFNGARTIAGLSGSAMHNILFQKMGQNSIVLGNLREPFSPHVNQIMCEKFVDSKANYIPYRGVEKSEANNHFKFDVEYLEDELKKILVRKKPNVKSSEESSVENRQICVLGMHRSGTSCLAGALQAAGIFAGNINKNSAYQPMGNRENPYVVSCNNKLLSDKNFSWRNPGEVLEWTNQLATERKFIISDLNRQASIWMFKDPRTLFTLEFWKQALPDMHLVATFRDPLNVSLSLAGRNNMPILEGFKLYNLYNSQLLSLRERYDFPIICFDADTDEYKSQLRKLLKDLDTSFGLDVTLNVDRGIEFFNGTARQSQINRIDISQISDPSVRDVFSDSYDLYDKLISFSNVSKNPLNGSRKIILPFDNGSENLSEDNLPLATHLIAYMEYEQNSDFPLAIQHLKVCIVNEPDNFYFKVKLADLLFRNGEFEKSISIIIENRLFDDNSLSIFKKASRALIKCDRKERVLELCLNISEYFDEHPEWLGDISKIIFDLGAYEDSLILMERFKNLQPYNFKPYVLLARGYLALKRLDVAESYVDQGSNVSPNRTNYELVEVRALIRENRNLIAEAVDGFNHLLRIGKLKPYLYVNLVRGLVELGQSGEAKDVLRQADENLQHKPNILSALKLIDL